MRRYCCYLALMLLGFACKKVNAQKDKTENIIIRYTFDEGFTGVQKNHIIAISREIASKHELAGNANIVLLPKADLQKIIKKFEDNNFKDIRTQRMLVADRGGVSLEIRYLKPEMCIIKADAGESFVQKEDKDRFNQCKDLIEKYLSEY